MRQLIEAIDRDITKALIASGDNVPAGKECEYACACSAALIVASVGPLVAVLDASPEDEAQYKKTLIAAMKKFIEQHERDK